MECVLSARLLLTSSDLFGKPLTLKRPHSRLPVDRPAAATERGAARGRRPVTRQTSDYIAAHIGEPEWRASFLNSADDLITSRPMRDTDRQQVRLQVVLATHVSNGLLTADHFEHNLGFELRAECAIGLSPTVATRSCPFRRSRVNAALVVPLIVDSTASSGQLGYAEPCSQCGSRV